MICNLGIPARWLRRPSALNHRRRMRIVQTAAFARQIASCRRGSVAAGVRHGTQWTGKRLIRRRTLAMIRVPRISPSRMDGDRALEAATKYRPPTRQRPHLGHDGPRISPARQLSWWPSPLWRPQCWLVAKAFPLPFARVEPTVHFTFVRRALGRSIGCTGANLGLENRDNAVHTSPSADRATQLGWLMRNGDPYQMRVKRAGTPRARAAGP